MDIFGIIGKIKELKKKGVNIKFQQVCNDAGDDCISIVLKNGLPKGVYIPFSQASTLMEIWRELKEEDGKDKDKKNS